MAESPREEGESRTEPIRNTDRKRRTEMLRARRGSVTDTDGRRDTEVRKRPTRERQESRGKEPPPHPGGSGRRGGDEGKEGEGGMGEQGVCRWGQQRAFLTRQAVGTRGPMEAGLLPKPEL